MHKVRSDFFFFRFVSVCFRSSTLPDFDQMLGIVCRAVANGNNPVGVFSESDIYSDVSVFVTISGEHGDVTSLQLMLGARAEPPPAPHEHGACAHNRNSKQRDDD